MRFAQKASDHLGDVERFRFSRICRKVEKRPYQTIRNLNREEGLESCLRRMRDCKYLVLYVFMANHHVDDRLEHSHQKGLALPGAALADHSKGMERQ